MALAVVLSGLLVGFLGYYPVFGPLALVGLVPFLYSLTRTRTYIHTALIGLAFGVVYGGVILAPYITLDHWQWGMSEFVAAEDPAWGWLLVVVGAMFVFGGVLFALFSLVFHACVRRWGAVWLIAPLLWLLLELARAGVLGGLTTGHIGYTQVLFPPTAGWAVVGTVYLVGVLVVWCNALITQYIMKGGLMSGFRAVGVSLIVGYVGIGGFLLHSTTQQEQELHTVALQVPYTTEESSNPEVFQEILQSISGSISSTTSIVLLPENVFPFFVLDRDKRTSYGVSTDLTISRLYESFVALSRSYSGTYFVLGMHSAHSIERRHNSILVYKDGAVVTSYDKRMLLPFGETSVPFIFGHTTPLVPGNNQPLLSFGDVHALPLICSEVHYVAPREHNYTHVIHLSNETIFSSGLVSRYGKTLAAMRSLEAGAPLLRSTKVSED